MRKKRSRAQGPGPDERRILQRIPVDIEVDYQCEETFLFAYITDISTMGIFVRTTTPHPTGTQLNLHFTPPGGPSINIKGEVVWINPPRPGDPDSLNPGMGIQFVDLDQAMKDQIQKLIKTFAYLDDEETTMGHS